MTLEEAAVADEKARARYYKRNERPVPTRRGATALARSLAPKPTIINRKGLVGWPTWCVPTSMLAQFIRDHQDFLNAEYTPLPQETYLDVRSTSSHKPEKLISGEGWRQLLAARTARTLCVTEEATQRRIYEIIYERREVTNVSFAEATCIALGITLDKDTTLPTLPGNQKAAEELVRCRADHYVELLDDLKVKRLGHTVVRLSRLVVAYPHNVERLQDLAPFDCLRPYR